VPADPNRAEIAASPLWVRLLGAYVAGGVFFLLLLAGPVDDARPAAWGIASLGAVGAIALFLLAVVLVARPGRPEPGRLTADFLTVFAATVGITIVGYPLVAALGLSTGGL
jgi:hypothetical protein